MCETSTKTAQQRAQLVLCLLSMEEPAGRIAWRVGISEQTLYCLFQEFIGAGKQVMYSRGGQGELVKALERLSVEVADGDGVFEELMIANRVFEKTLGQVDLSSAVSDQETCPLRLGRSGAQHCIRRKVASSHTKVPAREGI